MYNITQSLGFSIKVNDKPQFYYIAQAYQKVLDIAYLEVSTGTIDYNTATKNAVKSYLIVVLSMFIMIKRIKKK